MNEIYDLHSHSTASDGALSPSELVERAHIKGVTSLALTDHDTTAGLEQAQQAANDANITLIRGLELSTTWNKKCLHIVGLNIDPSSPPLKKGIQDLQAIRQMRSEKIACKLEKKKIPGALDAVTTASGGGMITRTHFADFLLSNHYVSTMQEAFDRYLGAGKPAFVATEWAPLENAVNWITQSGGVAVLAHPMRYKMTARWMNRLLGEYSEMGGQGIEVVSGRSNTDEIRRAAEYARRFDLYGSTGSDFHNPKNPWVELGRLAPLPEGIKPVWELLNTNHTQNP